MHFHFKKKRSPINSKTAMNQIWSILGVSMDLSFDLVHNNIHLVRHFTAYGTLDNRAIGQQSTCFSGFFPSIYAFVFQHIIHFFLSKEMLTILTSKEFYGIQALTWYLPWILVYMYLWKGSYFFVTVTNDLMTKFGVNVP